MTQTLSLLMAQINPTVGGIEANTQRIIEIILVHMHHDIIIFPELTLTGYSPEDLLLRPELFYRVEQALDKIKSIVKNTHVIIGHPTLDNGQCYNSVSILYQGKSKITYHKQNLPNYSVFDEQRYFKPGPKSPCVFTIKDHRFGLCICEDIWQQGPVDDLIAEKIDTLLVSNASPFDYTKPAKRIHLLKQYAEKGISIIYVNQVGGQDELLFDGQSLAMNQKGEVCAQSVAFEEALDSITLTKENIEGHLAAPLEPLALIYQALCCGLRDYMRKNGLKDVLLGLSGGIDSALTLAIAVDALGPQHVQAVLMPSRYTKDMSIEDAITQANLLEVSHTTLSIEPAFQTLTETLGPSFKGLNSDITEENMQARIRGLLLMALSNKTGKLVLTTSNKSETAVGFATLYGDMCGGFSVLKDVLKTEVYALAKYRNALNPIIPQRVIERAPTAELAPNQTDQDRLPDYAILDAVITQYMQNKLSIQEIVELGYSWNDVSSIVHLLQKNEYKRRQSAIGVKISPCAFGKDWRYPVTASF